MRERRGCAYCSRRGSGGPRDSTFRVVVQPVRDEVLEQTVRRQWVSVGWNRTRSASLPFTARSAAAAVAPALCT